MMDKGEFFVSLPPASDMYEKLLFDSKTIYPEKVTLIDGELGEIDSGFRFIGYGVNDQESDLSIESRRKQPSRLLLALISKI